METTIPILINQHHFQKTNKESLPDGYTRLLIKTYPFHPSQTKNLHYLYSKIQSTYSPRKYRWYPNFYADRHWFITYPYQFSFIVTIRPKHYQTSQTTPKHSFTIS